MGTSQKGNIKHKDKNVPINNQRVFFFKKKLKKIEKKKTKGVDILYAMKDVYMDTKPKRKNTKHWHFFNIKN